MMQRRVLLRLICLVGLFFAMLITKYLDLYLLERLLDA
mgnify:CR=1 FL=1